MSTYTTCRHFANAPVENTATERGHKAINNALTREAAPFTESQAKFSNPNDRLQEEKSDTVKKVYADKLETSTKWEIPKDVIPVPCGAVSYTNAAEVIFNAFASKNTLFIREDVVHEIKRGKIDTLQPVEPERFCSIVEKVGKRIARREVDNDKKVTWRSARFPQNAAKIILATDEAKTVLPNIYQLTNCPIITPDGSILTKGYHAFNGGTYISTGDFVPEVSLDRAVKALVDLLRDFAFTTPADKSRAVASLISPALKMGGHISDDFPLDFAEADKSQSGKTYRQMLVTRLYNEAPAAIIQPKGGVGSLDESISKVLIQGRPFVVFDNIRGKVDSQIMETAIRGVGKVNCRIPHMAPIEVNSKPFLWQLSTNGAELTRDLANRSIITRIRKQPEDYRWHEYLEGDLLSHVISRQAIYLGAIFAVVRAWLDAGSPRTKECRHDFRDWVQVMDWIVQNLFKMPPLLDGHREEQARTANPRLQWLRDVAFATADSQMTGRELSASELCTIAEDAGIELPGNPYSKEEPHQRAGKILGLLYRENGGETISVDGFSVTRTETIIYDNGKRTHRFYTFLCPPVTPSHP